MDGDRRVLEPGTVVVEDDRIAAVGPAHSTEVPGGAEVIDARGMAVLPGLVNAHSHVAQILLRGGASPDRDLFDWLFNVLYPGLGAYEPVDVEVATRLYCVEALRHGVTTVVDNEDGGVGRYEEFADASIRAFTDCGMRAVYARMYADAPAPALDGLIATVMAKEPEVRHVDVVEPLPRIVADLDRIMRKHHGAASGRISVWPSPGSPVSVSVEGLHAAQRLATEHGTSWALHLAEVAAEHTALAMSPTEFLHDHHCLDGRLLAGHCVHVDARDIRLLTRAGARVSTQPVSNGYLGSGVAPVPQMLAAGLTVGVGTDDACCNDSVNLLGDIKTMVVLHKAVNRDASVLTAERALEMVTIDGARAVGMANDIGSLAVGKLADVVLVDLRHAQTTPAHDLAATLVYQAGGGEVDTVLVDGRVLVRGGRPTFLTPEEEQLLYEDAGDRAAKILARAGMRASRPWRSVGA
jgi:atrazine chlorohydrolase/5-methylthioadenosine/S-adenosylhomocysteine deaminase/melamine deaminase